MFFGVFFDFGTFGKSPEALPSSVHTNFSIRIDQRHPETPIPGPDSGNLHFLSPFWDLGSEGAPRVM